MLPQNVSTKQTPDGHCEFAVQVSVQEPSETHQPSPLASLMQIPQESPQSAFANPSVEVPGLRQLGKFTYRMTVGVGAATVVPVMEPHTQAEE